MKGQPDRSFLAVELQESANDVINRVPGYQGD